MLRFDHRGPRLNKYDHCFRMSKSDAASAVEKTLPNLLVRTGDTAARTRDQAKSFILEESAFPEVKVSTRSTSGYYKVN